MISAQHHFYLSFENSVCDAYATEKLFWPMQQLIVPIVLKRSIAMTFIPHGSFIAVDDFESPKHLADYLKRLLANKDEYLKLVIPHSFSRILSEKYPLPSLVHL
ncbi:unnamed protein product [Anisakis simplex]|uniref:Fucosyltransferase n=1 Tax=Anisakis simplex TaxID=6269 RepID=A0A3P6PF00_ANISI|nr:unnamed protein product [Anisakis simplex]